MSELLDELNRVADAARETPGWGVPDEAHVDDGVATAVVEQRVEGYILALHLSDDRRVCFKFDIVGEPHSCTEYKSVEDAIATALDRIHHSED